MKTSFRERVKSDAYAKNALGLEQKTLDQRIADNITAITHDRLGKDVGKSYLDYGNATQLAEDGIRAGSSPLFSNDGGSFTSKVLGMSVKPIGTRLGRMLYKAGNGAEYLGNIGKKTAKTVGEVLGISEEQSMKNSYRAQGNKRDQLMIDEKGNELNMDKYLKQDKAIFQKGNPVNTKVPKKTA